MKKLTRFLSYVLVAALASAVTFGVTAPKEEPYKLQELQDLIETYFIGEADTTAMEDMAAMGMIEALGDRWSYYIPAAEYASHMEQVNNAYVGVGITIRAADDGTGFLILQVEATGPAAEAGIEPGDVLIAVNGQSAVGMTMDDTGVLVKGEAGTTVDLTVRRGEDEITFTVERRRVMVTVAKGQMLPDGIGLVTIHNFDARCYDETIAAIGDLLDQGAEKLIFDVRNNPGGYKEELVKVLDYLLPEGPLFRSENYAGKTQVDESDAACLDIPMAVLVNSESYSAAEFFAAALEEYDAAITVGEKTSGKGYYQVTTELSDGSAVALSMGKYTTPNGVSLAEEGGLTPRVEVAVDDETFVAIYAGILEPENDPQLQAAVNALNEG